MMIKFGRKPREKKVVDPLEGLKVGDILVLKLEFLGGGRYSMVFAIHEGIILLGDDCVNPEKLEEVDTYGRWFTLSALRERGYSIFKRVGVVQLDGKEYDEEQVKERLKGLKPIA